MDIFRGTNSSLCVVLLQRILRRLEEAAKPLNILY